jgi:hypothetical protein
VRDAAERTALVGVDQVALSSWQGEEPPECGGAERQHADREEPAQHRAELRQAALQMLAVASRPQDTPPGARQHIRRDGQECEQGAPERDLAQRIGGKLPLHDRIAAGEHRGGAYL